MKTLKVNVQHRADTVKNRSGIFIENSICETRIFKGKCDVNYEIN